MNLFTQDACPIPDYCTRPNCSHTKLERRFWAKVKIGKLNECWEWTSDIGKNGYGNFEVKKNNKFIHVRAHRLAYELLDGNPIPAGLVIDHLCRNHRCVNPFHLEVVTCKENIHRGDGNAAVNARKTRCKYGHPLSGDNLYIRPNNSGRTCKICNMMNNRKFRRKHT